MLAKQFKVLDGLFAALYEIGRVEDALEPAAEVLDQLQTPCGHVAVNALFVFMAEGDMRLFRQLRHPAEPVDHFVSAVLRGNACRKIEGEHPDVPAFQHVRDFQHVPEPVQMGGKPAVVQRDFADGRADGPDGKPAVPESAQDVRGFFF